MHQKSAIPDRFCTASLLCRFIAWSGHSRSRWMCSVVNCAVIFVHSITTWGRSGYYIFPDCIACSTFEPEAPSWDGNFSPSSHTRTPQPRTLSAWRAFPWASLVTDVPRQSAVSLFLPPAWWSKMGLSWLCSQGGAVLLFLDSIRLTYNHLRPGRPRHGSNQLHPAAGLSGLESMWYK